MWCGYVCFLDFHIWGINTLFSRAGEMARWPKHLLFKPHDLGVDPQNTHKIQHSSSHLWSLGSMSHGRGGEAEARMERNTGQPAWFLWQWVMRDPNPNKVGGKDWFGKLSLISTLMLWYMCVHIHEHTHTYTNTDHTHIIYTRVIYALIAHKSHRYFTDIQNTYMSSKHTHHTHKNSVNSGWGQDQSSIYSCIGVTMYCYVKWYKICAIVWKVGRRETY